MRNAYLFLALFFSQQAVAESANTLLKKYELLAKQENSAFVGFAADKGERFFHAERLHSDGKKVSCATCHTADPSKPGKTRANKVIEAMAISVNPQRFSDEAKVEKWFGRNCKDVLERACTAQEKGDFIAYLLSIK